MSFRRALHLAVITFAFVICISCGQVYRPVVIPVSTTPPDPANFHTVFVLNANVGPNPGSAFQIDVSGDTSAGATTGAESANNIGINPTHATVLANNSRIFVASAGSLVQGGVDTVSAFSPAADSTTATGLGSVFHFSLPSGSLPVFLSSALSSVVYVAGYGSAQSSSLDCLTGCVAVLSPSTVSVSRIVPVASNPVSLAALPNGTKLYTANLGSNTVSSFNTVDMSQSNVAGFGGTSPVWVVARSDSQKAYVLTAGDGNLYTIDTVTDTVSSALSVGAGANYLAYDSKQNRLYVTNPATAMVYVFSTTGGTGDTPTLLAAISLTAGATPPCPNGCSPVSIAALPDGSRFYVASYRTADPCPDPLSVDSNNASVPCVIPQVTVFDAKSFTVKVPALSLLMPLHFASGQYAVPQVSSCDPAPTPFQIGYTRFRLSTTAAVDSSRVYIGICDAGVVAIVNATTSTTSTGTNNTPDTLVTDLPAPFSSGPAGSNGLPPFQNTIFVLPGQ